VTLDKLERRLRARLDALGLAPRAELLHVLRLPDLERAERIGEFLSYPQSRIFAELLIDCEEDRDVGRSSSVCCGRRRTDPDRESSAETHVLGHLLDAVELVAGVFISDVISSATEHDVPRAPSIAERQTSLPLPPTIRS
jgi:hypothetical protein